MHLLLIIGFEDRLKGPRCPPIKGFGVPDYGIINILFIYNVGLMNLRDRRPGWIFLL